MAPTFVNVQPAGQVLSGEELLVGLRSGHGANPEFRITISECALRWVSTDGATLLASYAEHQQGARNTRPPDNTRVSSLLLDLHSAVRPRWLHLQETARIDG